MKKNQVIIIDLGKLEGYGLTLKECLTLIGIYSSECSSIIEVDVYDTLLSKSLITMSGITPSLTLLGTEVVKKFSTKKLNLSKKEVKPDHELFSKDFIDRYRSLFKGLKAGAMGYADGVHSKMTRFFESNPEVTEEQVLNATKAYLNSLENYNYLQQADYFIYKRDTTGSESSRLSAFLDETKGGTTSTDLRDEGWSSKIG